MDINASEYFLSRCPDSGPERPLYVRIAHALGHHGTPSGTTTMLQLCEMSEKELKKIRNIGDKSRAILMEECRNYQEQAKRTHTA